ncbi:hypothetical protein OG870_17285 [Streptomyces sp. NBC_00461]|uniref:hypothetical protein n=1 Tax=Streptomyces sp. NBC_00461 TaxID=2975750 RepID=UPI002E17B4AC
MTLVLTLVGTSPVLGGAVGVAYNLWTYKIDGSNQEIPQGQRLALALSSDINVLDPATLPGVTALQGTFLQKDPADPRQYVGRLTATAGPQTISFVAPVRAATGEILLMKTTPGNPLVSVPFAVTTNGPTSHAQKITMPGRGAPAYAGRPLADFTGAPPYASELFGIYHPLTGWFGASSSMAAATAHPESAFAGLTTLGQFKGANARTMVDQPLAALAGYYDAGAIGGLSPVGLVNLFREYFFEFDTFLGSPVGHIWVSPGGTVEVVETSTRRTLVEKVSEVSESASQKSEESLTDQDDVADAVKEENSTDTKLGVSATGGVNAKIYHADVSASFGTENTVKRGSEETHKHTRTQSAKATSEITRNFKTSFKTVTETTDTSSRRYVLTNPTGSDLVNYELRRKMRKVGVQLQHVGTRLCWQVFIGDPGRELGLGDMVHVAEAPDLTAVQKPEMKPLPQDQKLTHQLSLPFVLTHGADHDAQDTYTPDTDPNVGIFKPDVGANDLIQFRFDFSLPEPPDGYEIKKGVPPEVDFHGAQVQYTVNPHDLGMTDNPDRDKKSLGLRLTYANFQGNKSLPFSATIVYSPKAETTQAIEKANQDAQDAYQKQVARLQHDAYGKAVRERLQLVSTMRSRTPEDLRSEERRVVFRNLIRRLEQAKQYPKDPSFQPFPEAEGIQHLFDVEEMLYFVAPDYWRPGLLPAPPTTTSSTGRYPLPPEDETSPTGDAPLPLQGQTVAGWYSRAEKYKANDGQATSPDEWRVDYLITDQTQPAPLGSSLGWLIQIDSDERRNEFLNAAWVKAVLPVRPGQEQAALNWLTQVEGEAGLDVGYVPSDGDPSTYQGKKVGEVLTLLAKELSTTNADPTTTQASEKVFENGFDPLAGGFQPAKPYQVFDQWVEVLPTDQVVATAVRYDAKTGQQL